MARDNTRRMHVLRDLFRTDFTNADAHCWMCELPIDYAAPYDDYANDDRFQFDHYYPVSTHPELQEDSTNFRASHAGCNRDRGNGARSSASAFPHASGPNRRARMVDVTHISMPSTITVTADSIPRPLGNLTTTHDLNVSVIAAEDEEGNTNYVINARGLRTAMIAALREAADDLEAEPP